MLGLFAFALVACIVFVVVLRMGAIFLQLMSWIAIGWAFITLYHVSTGGHGNTILAVFVLATAWFLRKKVIR